MDSNYILLNRIFFSVHLSMSYNHRKNDSVKKLPKFSSVIGAATVKTIMITIC